MGFLQIDPFRNCKYILENFVCSDLKITQSPHFPYVISTNMFIQNKRIDN